MIIDGYIPDYVGLREKARWCKECCEWADDGHSAECSQYVLPPKAKKSAVSAHSRYSTPLPPTDKYPVVMRKCGNIDGVTELPTPPYIVAGIESGVLHVDLYDAEGYRVGYDRENRDASKCLYADDDTAMPAEWREPLAKALAEIRIWWPYSTPVFRPVPADFDPQL